MRMSVHPEISDNCSTCALVQGMRTTCTSSRILLLPSPSIAVITLIWSNTHSLSSHQISLHVVLQPIILMLDRCWKFMRAFSDIHCSACVLWKQAPACISTPKLMHDAVTTSTRDRSYCVCRVLFFISDSR